MFAQHAVDHYTNTCNIKFCLFALGLFFLAYFSWLVFLGLFFLACWLSIANFNDIVVKVAGSGPFEISTCFERLNLACRR
jgi:hypothetical protein